MTSIWRTIEEVARTALQSRMKRSIVRQDDDDGDDGDNGNDDIEDGCSGSNCVRVNNEKITKNRSCNSCKHNYNNN